MGRDGKDIQVMELGRHHMTGDSSSSPARDSLSCFKVVQCRCVHARMRVWRACVWHLSVVCMSVCGVCECVCLLSVCAVYVLLSIGFFVLTSDEVWGTLVLFKNRSGWNANRDSPGAGGFGQLALVPLAGGRWSGQGRRGSRATVPTGAVSRCRAPSSQRSPKGCWLPHTRVCTRSRTPPSGSARTPSGETGSPGRWERPR